MATTTKKRSNTKKAKPRSPSLKTSATGQARTVAELRQQLAESLRREKATAKELQDRDRQLGEALEQQEATSETLSAIARSPMDLQSVLDAVAESAARLCDSLDAQIYRLEGEIVRKVAHYGVVPTPLELGETRPLSRASASGRAILDRQTIHIQDMLSERERDYPDVWHAVQRDGIRTVLCVPLLREGVPIGAIGIRRVEVRPFTGKQIKLLKTFADQAVIAIENARLFNELKESLEQQTATSEILGVIASSPTDIQPVLNVVAENASRLCDATDSIIYRVESDHALPVAHYGPVPALQHYYRPLSRGLPVGRTIIDRKTIHIHDVVAEIETEFPEARALQRDSGTRTMLLTPLLREDMPIGAISIRRTEVRPFSEKHILLLKIFADQAVIAIENVRLFNELKESLEQQTATSEILGVIASSPTDVKPVLDAVAENAARLCNSQDGQIYRVEGDLVRKVASYGAVSLLVAVGETQPISRSLVSGRAILERRTVHVEDLASELDREFPETKPLLAQGQHTTLATPLLREGVPIGVILIRRLEVRPFSDKQIKLLETFAAQAVIAIENVRLFKELQERNRDLTEALEQQTTTSEILRVIAKSPTDIQPVLDAIVESSARLCSAKDTAIRLVEGNILRVAAHQGPIPFLAASEIPMNRSSVTGRAVVDRQLIHVEDLLSVAATEFPETRAAAEREGDRTVLGATCARRRYAWSHSHSSYGSRSFHGQANCAYQNFCRPGGNRH